MYSNITAIDQAELMPENGRMKLSASLMCADQLNILKNVISLIKLGVDAFHFDVMDGNFVNNLALNFDTLKEIRPLTRLSLDVHLMVQHPSRYFDRLIESGADIIIFHVECAEDVQKNIEYLKSKDVKVGLALHLQTPISAVEKYLPEIDYILLMNVKTGFAGQKFDVSLYQKSNALYSYITAKKYNVKLISDGGITLNHIEPLYNNGIDMVVAGTSLLFNQNGFSNNLNKFSSIGLNPEKRIVQELTLDFVQETKYKSAVLRDVNDFVLQEKTLRALKKDEVVVKVMSCGICGSDLIRVYKKGMYAKNLIPGHEMAGIIVKTNEEDAELINVPVAIFPLIPCKECKHCKLEKYNLCENYNYLGSRTDGGFSELVIVPKANIIQIKSNLSYDEAAMIEPMAVAHHAVKRLGNLPNASVLILGLGPIGILVGMFCKKFGAQKIIGFDRNESKCNIAKNVGFSDCIKDKTIDVKEFDILIDACGDSKLLGDNLIHLKKEGYILFLANYESGLSFSSSMMSTILRNEFNLFSSWNSNISDNICNDWKICADYLAKGELDVKPLITHVFPLKDIVQVFDKIKNHELNYLKVIINPNLG